MEQLQLSESEKKKRYLRGYRISIRRLKRLQSELTEVRSMKLGVSVNYDGMPHGSNGTGDLSGYAADLDKLERGIQAERYRRIKNYKSIKKCIDGLEDDRESDVLFYRYIKGFEWYQAAEVMGFSERHITRLHGKALAHLNVPKDVLECPIQK